jgi:hypothetical protein
MGTSHLDCSPMIESEQDDMGKANNVLRRKTAYKIQSEILMKHFSDCAVDR